MGDTSPAPQSGHPFAMAVWGGESQAGGENCCDLPTSLLAAFLQSEVLPPTAPSPHAPCSGRAHLTTLKEIKTQRRGLGRATSWACGPEECLGTPRIGGWALCVWCATATTPVSSFRPPSQELWAEGFQASFTRGIELRPRASSATFRLETLGGRPAPRCVFNFCSMTVRGRMCLGSPPSLAGPPWPELRA